MYFRICIYSDIFLDGGGKEAVQDYYIWGCHACIFHRNDWVNGWKCVCMDGWMDGLQCKDSLIIIIL